MEMSNVFIVPIRAIKTRPVIADPIAPPHVFHAVTIPTTCPVPALAEGQILSIKGNDMPIRIQGIKKAIILKMSW